MLPSTYFREIPEHRDNYIPLELSREAAREALANLPRGHYITFYDSSEPRAGSDPGTYFSMRRRGERWQITGGNHGWGHGIAEIGQDEAEIFLQFCLPSNRGPYPDCVGFTKDSHEAHWIAKWSGAALQKRITKVTSDVKK